MGNRELDWESGSIAQVWIVIFVTTFVVMLTYTIFYKFITVDMYDMVVYYAAGRPVFVSVAHLIGTFFRFFPVPFLFSMLIWGFMSSFRREHDEYRT